MEEKNLKTHLQRIIEEKGLTIGGVVSHMGFDSQVYTTFWGNKIKGKTTLTITELQMLCRSISSLSGSLFQPQDIQNEPVRFKLI